MLPRVVSRSISSSSRLPTRYDVRVFRDPVDSSKLDEPLSADDERQFMYIRAMKSDETPTFYRNHVVDKLIRVCMKDGRKETSKNGVLAALEMVKRRQYSAWLKAPEEEKDKIERNVFKIAEEAIRNCRPLMKLMPVTRGGTTYQVPSPIEEEEAEFRAMKSMRDICRQRAKGGETHFKDALASELLLASQNEGLTVQAKQELHKTCEANRAFAHYRG